MATLRALSDNIKEVRGDQAKDADDRATLRAELDAIRSEKEQHSAGYDKVLDQFKDAIYSFETTIVSF
jgi:hypothetical protein